MPLTCDQALSLFSRGELGELIRLFGSRNGAAQTTDQKARYIAAHACALMGNVEQAQELVGELNELTRTSTADATVETVLGLIAERKTGDSEDAIRHYQSASRLAIEARDFRNAAWAQLHLFRFLGEARPNDSDGMVHELRRTIARAADPTVTAYLHISLAVMEGQRGRTVGAKRHCDIAESISSLSPNVWITSNVLMNRGGIAILENRFAEAVKLFNEARLTADQD
jgi:tetratricopeptide (TPR) repeat protein